MNKKEIEIECDSCAIAGIHTPATGHSTNPDWDGYNLCDDCQSEYNNRKPINSGIK